MEVISQAWWRRPLIYSQGWGRRTTKFKANVLNLKLVSKARDISQRLNLTCVFKACSNLVIYHQQKQFMEVQIYFISQVAVQHWRMLRQKLGANTKVEAMYSPAPCLGMAPPIVGRTLLHHWAVKKVSHRHAYRAGWWRQFLSWGSFFPSMSSGQPILANIFWSWYLSQKETG